MSFNRKKIMEVERQGAVSFPDGSTLNFVFYPNKNTPNFSYDLEAAKARGEIKHFVTSWMLKLLKSWDVVDEALAADAPGAIEVPVPITEETLGDLPNNVIDALFAAMMDGMKTDPPSGTQSRGSFV